MYILKGGITEQQVDCVYNDHSGDAKPDDNRRQGRIPDDAFEGEDAVKLTEEEIAMRQEMEETEAQRKDKMGEETKKQLERDRRNLQVGGSRDEKLDMGDDPY